MQEYIKEVPRELKRENAKALLRVKRLWGVNFKERFTGEPKEERDERERSRETAARLDRVCPTQCWNAWSEWEGCSQPCGSGGIQWQTRTVKTGGALGECQAWAGSKGCAGPNRRSQACNRHCLRGTAHATGCTCPAGWTNQCCDQIVLCGNPGTPANSKLEFYSGSAYTYGSSVKVTCSHGYRLLGSTIRQCAATGRWSGTAPSCQLIECPAQPAPENGVVAYPTGRGLDDKLVYSCNTGFVLEGASRRLCQSNSQWTTPTGKCTQILCNDLPAPTNGQVTHSGSTGGKTKFGQKVTFSCNQGYVLQGLATLTCGGDTPVGKFDGKSPTCVLVDCGDPGNPANGVQAGSAFTLNQIVTFICSPGHFLQGQESITCLHTGKWSHARPQCSACAVNTYKPGTNNAKICMACPANSGTGSVTAATAQTQCLCIRGYKGNYGGPCSLIQCPALPIPVNGHKVSCGDKLDEKCIFECNAGHVISRGDIQRTCTERETWTGKNVQCDACPIHTYKLSASQCQACPNNSRTTGIGNEKSGCLCMSGYQGLAGGPCNDINECATSNGGCDQTCVNRLGDYTCECTNAGSIKDVDDFKKCVAKNKCPEMTKPANGGTVCYSQRKTNTERCYVKCNNGFEHLVSPNAFEQCGPSTGWKWSFEIKGETVPDCIPAFFEGAEVEVEVHYFTADCDAITEAQKREISQEFISFLTGKGVCQASSQGTCSIDDVDIGCGDNRPSFFKRRKRDTRKEVIIRFKLKSDNKALPKDKECDLDCKIEMKNKTQTLILNQAKAVSDLFKQTNENNNRVTLGGIEMRQTEQVTVSESAPSCGKGKEFKNGACVTVSCGLPKPPVNGGMSVSGHLYTNVTTFNCSQYHALKGDNSTKCQANGKWSVYNTLCVLVSCGNPGTPANSKQELISGSAYTYGSSVKVTCSHGYHLLGSTIRQCAATGRWSGTAPSCQLIECPAEPAPANGVVAYPTGRGLDDRLVYSCKTGFVLEGARRRLCQSNSQWTTPTGTCTLVDCGDPGSPANGVQAGSAFTFNQSVTFTCSPGHFLQGQEGITCLHTGKWSHTRPQCSSCAANTYKPGTNNAKTCTACPANSGTGNVTAGTANTQCLCVRGYKGNPGGPCSSIQCPTLPTPANGRKVSCGNKLDEKCLFECNVGHVISRGNMQRTCTEKETWTGSDVQCTACPIDTYKLSASQCEACPNNSRTNGTGNEKNGCLCITGYEGPGGGPCTDYKDLQYDCTTRDPCKPLRVPTRYYYRHTDGDKFIHCSAEGICNEKTCPRPLVWSNKLLVCVWKWHLET